MSDLELTPRDLHPSTGWTPSPGDVEDIEEAALEGDRPFRPGTARAALSYSAFRRVYGGSIASNVGSWMQNVVLTAYALNLTQSPTFVGIMTFAQLGPLLFVSLIGGSLADRFDRRTILIIGSIEQALFAFTLAYITRDPNPSLVALVLCVFAIGMGQAIVAPTFSSVLPSLVEPRDLPGAVSLTSVNMNLSRMVGALIGPFVYVAFGVSWVFAINGLTYFFIIAGVATVAVPRAARIDDGLSSLRRIVSGFGIVRRDVIMTRVLVTLTTFSFFSLIFVAQLPTVASYNFGISEKSAEYGALYAIFALGAMTGALSVGTFLAGRDLARMVRAGLVLFAMSLVLFALVRRPTLAYVVAPILGFWYFLVITSLSTVLHKRLDNNNRGRVMAIWIMAFGGTVPIGNLVAGPVIEATSITAVMLVGAAVALGLAFYARLSTADEPVAMPAAPAT